MSMGEFVMVVLEMSFLFFFFSSRRRHTRCSRDWSSDMCSRSVGCVVRDLRHGGELGRCALAGPPFLKLGDGRSEEHTSELQSRLHLVCRLLLEKKKKKKSASEAGHQDTHG